MLYGDYPNIYVHMLHNRHSSGHIHLAFYVQNFNNYVHYTIHTITLYVIHTFTFRHILTGEPKGSPSPLRSTIDTRQDIFIIVKHFIKDVQLALLAEKSSYTDDESFILGFYVEKN